MNNSRESREVKKLLARSAAARRDVGLALREINRRKFYLHTHKTFADYCQEKWGISPQFAYQLIAESGPEQESNREHLDRN